MYISLGNSIFYRQNKNGTITYYHSYRENKKVKRRKLFVADSLSDKNYKKALLQSLSMPEEENKKEFITLDFLADKYFEAREKKIIGEMRRKYNHLKHLSVEDFSEVRVVKNKLQGMRSAKNTYNKHVRKKHIAIIPITSIKREDLKFFLDDDLNLQGISQKTVFNIISQMKTIINFGISNDYGILINPMKNFTVKNPKRKRTRYLSIEELELLLQETREHKDPNVYLSVYLGVLTAARATSVLNIQKKDIDFKNNTIKIDNFKSNKFYFSKISKKGSDWLKKITLNLDNEDYLIRAKKPSGQAFKAIPRGVFQIMDKLFNQDIDKQNNLDRDNVVNFHTIRRSIATNMALNGVDIYKIMLLLNHTSIKQTQDYLNLSDLILTEDIELLNEQIFKNF